MLFEKCDNLYQIYDGSRPSRADIAFIVMHDANDSHRANDKSHVVMRKVEKQGAIWRISRQDEASNAHSEGEIHRVGWRIAGEDASSQA